LCEDPPLRGREDPPRCEDPPLRGREDPPLRGREDTRFFSGMKLEHIQSSRMTKMVINPAAHAHEAVAQVEGWSTKTAIKGSKKLSSRLSKRPVESSRNPPSGTIESEHAGESSFGSKHSHFGRIVPLTVFAKLHIPPPAQLNGQNISGQA